MNCPKCKVTVGNDQHHISEWEPVEDFDTGQIIGSTRTITVLCEHCGLHVATQREGGNIVSIRQAKTGKSFAAAMNRIPGARFAEVMA